jgi:hypothetical protein
VVLPWTPPSQTTDPWLPKGQFLQSEGAFQGGFDELHARKPRVDLKRCKRARSKTACILFGIGSVGPQVRPS